jgi:hypothetical protein
MLWLWIATISAKKWCSVRLYLQLFVGELMSCLHYLLLLAYSGVQHILAVWVAWWVSYKRHELFVLRGRLGLTLCLVVSMFLIFLVLCFLVFVLCLVYPMLSVFFMDFPFLIVFIYRLVNVGFIWLITDRYCIAPSYFGNNLLRCFFHHNTNPNSLSKMY